MRRLFLFAALLLGVPSMASAHEVYVLSKASVAQAIAMPSFSEWRVLLANLHLFMFWAFIVGLMVFVVFGISLLRPLERWCAPLFRKLPRYAPVVGRVTIGLSFLLAAHYGALGGPELPLIDTFGAYHEVISVVLTLTGLLFVFGLYTRIAAIIGFILFGFEIAAHGTYMLTYSNYVGELTLLLILGAHELGFQTRRRDELYGPRLLLKLKKKLTPYSFLIARLCFGTALLFASLYAKVLHNNLALFVAYQNPAVVHFFGMEPHFLVLGAAIIEILIALFFIFGIEIRFTSLFLLFWLTLSLWYFGEAVWPHLILIGIPISFIFYGYDKYSLEGWLFKKYNREPVL